MTNITVNSEATLAAAHRALDEAFNRWNRIHVEITPKPPGNKRSNEQNAYLFGVCYPLLAKAKGYQVDDIHTWMCGRHFGWVDRTVPKTPRNMEGIESVPFRTTTRDENGKRSVLTTMQFMDFVAMVQQVGADAGVYIPDPNEVPG